MNDETLARRMAKFSARPVLAEMPMELREELLEEAVDAFRAYTGADDPGAVADSLIVRMAVVSANKVGAEGSTKTGEGDIDRMFENDLPADLKRELNRYRRPVGV